MLDVPIADPQPGLILRRVPAAKATGAEPIRIGGLPRLPDGVAWPTNRYHLAEIDFAALPRFVTVNGERHALPQMPQGGSAFVFLSLYGDEIYGHDNVQVVFSPGDVAALPGRTPPQDLPDLNQDSEYDHVNRDGLSICGRVLAESRFNAIPALTAPAINPLRINMAAAGGADISAFQLAYGDHQREVAKALAPDPAEPSTSTGVKREIPKKVRDFCWRFQDRHFDWQFIFDWAQEFYLGCCDMALEHLDLFEEAGQQRLLTWIARRRVNKVRLKAESLTIDAPKRPFGWVQTSPTDTSESFDNQARAFMVCALGRSGPVPASIRAAFVAMLQEIERHYDDTDDEGYSLDARNGVLDAVCKGHDKHAGHTLITAQDAFSEAAQLAWNREATRIERLPPDARWEKLVENAALDEADQADSGHRFSLGHLPLQIFGAGFEIQSAVRDNADKILLLQLGDPSSGIPVHFGGDGILQIWITPEDLADGRFDRVTTTLDCT